MDPSSNNLCHVNVGGIDFTFSRSTIKEPHMNDTIFKTTALGENNNVPPYFEVEPDLFRKWLDPFIRNGRYPDKQDLTSPSERNRIIDAANTCGLIALAQYVESEIPKQLKATQVTKVKIPFKLEANRLTFFSCAIPNGASIPCADKSCNTLFNAKQITIDWRSYMLLDPCEVFSHYIYCHNGSKKIIMNNFNPKYIREEGYIKCELKEYVPLMKIFDGENHMILH